MLSTTAKRGRQSMNRQITEDERGSRARIQDQPFTKLQGQYLAFIA